MVRGPDDRRTRRRGEAMTKAMGRLRFSGIPASSASAGRAARRRLAGGAFGPQVPEAELGAMRGALLVLAVTAGEQPPSGLQTRVPIAELLGTAARTSRSMPRPRIEYGGCSVRGRDGPRRSAIQRARTDVGGRRGTRWPKARTLPARTRSVSAEQGLLHVGAGAGLVDLVEVDVVVPGGAAASPPGRADQPAADASARGTASPARRRVR